MISALALTTAFNAGQTQTWIDGGDEWQVHVGAGAQAGLFANELAAAGLVGGAHALDGPAGFFSAVVGRKVCFSDIAGDFDPSAAIEENSIKKYPVSGICQSVVLASERLSVKLPADKPITAILVEMNPFEMRYPGTLNRGPFRAFGDRLMSVAFCTASVLRHRGFRFEDFHIGPDAERDRLADMVKVADDERLPLLSSRVTVTTPAGTTTEHVENSRRDVAIEWDSVDDWAEALWKEAGRAPAEYRACRAAILDLPNAAAARILT
jgi:2-methylcitrate dehydratase PrpD